MKRFACFALAALGACRHAETPPPPRPPVVQVTRAVQRDVPIYREWVATLDGYVNAQIRPRVSGYLLSQHFREGSRVRKGEVLFEIDPRPFQASLAQAKANLEQQIANERRTERDVERDRPLVEARAIPRNQLDNDVELHRAAAAGVQAAQAAMRQAELDLSFTHVQSLIDGVVGITEVQIGNLVSPTSVLTTVSQIQPIKAFFAISEEDYLDTRDRLRGAALANVSAGADPIVFELTLTNGSRYPHTGSFLFADRQIDTLTGTIRIATSFPNPQLVLRPGQFGRIRAATQIQRNALLVPQRALVEQQGSYLVMVLRGDSTVHAQPVVVGPQVDSSWIIERGLEPGALVIVEGTQVVREGVKVAARPYGVPAPADTQQSVRVSRVPAGTRP